MAASVASSASCMHALAAASAPTASTNVPGSAQSAFFGIRPSHSAGAARRVGRRSRALVVEAKIREIFMPALSSTMTEGKIVSWVKSEGDKLNKGESVVVVESDKADMDVETFYDGYLAAIVVGEGEVAAVGTAIGLLAESEEEIAEAQAKGAESGNATAAASPAAPAPAPVMKEEVVAPPPAASATPASTAPVVVSTHPASDGGKRIVATPYAKKLAKDLKVNLATVVGTGPLGRIVASDVELSAGKTPAVVGPLQTAPAGTVATQPAQAKPAPSSAPAPTPSAVVPGTTVPFSAMQGAVSRNMVDSLTVPVFRVGYTINTDALDALYQKIKSKGVTMTALLAKATALALAKHPVVNASCKDGKSFTYNSSINVAVAVAMDGGILTPVLQDADKVDIYSLSRKWKELVDKARAKQLQPQEYNSGTFFLSNLGMFGVDRFDAILPPGAGAIMAVGASRPTVVAAPGGLFGVKNQIQVNVTADHRIIYGAELAAFLQTLAAIIEDPKDLTL